MLVNLKMSKAWELYKRPTEKQGELLDLRGMGEVRYYDENQFFDLENTRSPMFWLKMGFFYAIGLSSYFYCGKHSKAQRWCSTAILTAVPMCILMCRKGDDSAIGHLRNRSLEERLEFYPATRRALERAIQDVSS